MSYIPHLGLHVDRLSLAAHRFHSPNSHGPWGTSSGKWGPPSGRNLRCNSSSRSFQLGSKRSSKWRKLQVLDPWILLDQTLPVLYPDSKSRITWDVVMLCVILYVAIMVPLKIAFPEAERLVEGLVGLELSITTVLLVDVAVNFRTAYITPNGVLERDAKHIAARYLTGLFVFDVLAAVPFGLFSTTGTIHKVAPWFPLLKLLPLMRLVRMLKTSGPSAYSWAVFRIMVFMLLLSHWVCCFWHYLTISMPGSSWMFTERCASCSAPERYLTGFYSAFLLLLGDRPDTHNNLERAVVAALLFLGAMCYAIVVGIITLLVANMWAVSSRHKQRAAMVDDALRYRGVSHEVREQVGEYFEHLASFQHPGPDGVAFLQELPIGLYGTVVASMFAPRLSKVKLFAHTERPFLWRLAQRLRLSLFMAGDTIYNVGSVGHDMLLIWKGAVVLMEKEGSMAALMTDGDHFGELGLMVASAPRPHHAVALRPTDIMMLSRWDLQEAMKDFPDSAALIKGRARMRLEDHQSPGGNLWGLSSFWDVLNTQGMPFRNMMYDLQDDDDSNDDADWSPSVSTAVQRRQERQQATEEKSSLGQQEDNSKEPASCRSVLDPKSDAQSNRHTRLSGLLPHDSVQSTAGPLGETRESPAAVDTAGYDRHRKPSTLAAEDHQVCVSSEPSGFGARLRSWLHLRDGSGQQPRTAVPSSVFSQQLAATTGRNWSELVGTHDRRSEELPWGDGKGYLRNVGPAGLAMRACSSVVPTGPWNESRLTAAQRRAQQPSVASAAAAVTLFEGHPEEPSGVKNFSNPVPLCRENANDLNLAGTAAGAPASSSHPSSSSDPTTMVVEVNQEPTEYSERSSDHSWKQQQQSAVDGPPTDLITYDDTYDARASPNKPAMLRDVPVLLSRRMESSIGKSDAGRQQQPQSQQISTDGSITAVVLPTQDPASPTIRRFSGRGSKVLHCNSQSSGLQISPDLVPQSSLLSSRLSFQQQQRPQPPLDNLNLEELWAEVRRVGNGQTGASGANLAPSQTGQHDACREQLLTAGSTSFLDLQLRHLLSQSSLPVRSCTSSNPAAGHPGFVALTCAASTAAQSHSPSCSLPAPSLDSRPPLIRPDTSISRRNRQLREAARAEGLTASTSINKQNSAGTAGRTFLQDLTSTPDGSPKTTTAGNTGSVHPQTIHQGQSFHRAQTMDFPGSIAPAGPFFRTALSSKAGRNSNAGYGGFNRKRSLNFATTGANSQRSMDASTLIDLEGSEGWSSSGSSDKGAKRQLAALRQQLDEAHARVNQLESQLAEIGQDPLKLPSVAAMVQREVQAALRQMGASVEGTMFALTDTLHYVSEKTDELEQQIDSFDTRLERLEEEKDDLSVSPNSGGSGVLGSTIEVLTSKSHLSIDADAPSSPYHPFRQQRGSSRERQRSNSFVGNAMGNTTASRTGLSGSGRPSSRMRFSKSFQVPARGILKAESNSMDLRTITFAALNYDRAPSGSADRQSGSSAKGSAFRPRMSSGHG